MKENEVKELSFRFSLKIIEVYKFLQSKKEFVMSKQLLRCGTSIGANIEESQAAQSRKNLSLNLVEQIKRRERQNIG